MRYGLKMELPGVTQEQYVALHARLASAAAHATEWVTHISGPTQNGWYVIEVWESKAAFERFMQEHVAPLIPPGAPTPLIEELQVYSLETNDQVVV
jgi:hypothetical protein